MKTLLLSTALIAGFGSFAAAQEAATSPFRAEADPAAVRASNFIGARLYASETAVDATEYEGVQDGWNDIGEVNDVILSREGNVEAVLVDIGGFLGIGERQVAVDMSAVRFTSDSSTADDPNDWFLVLNADRTMLESAPAWEMSMNDSAVTTDPAVAADDTMAAGETATGTDGTTPVEDMANDTATSDPAAMPRTPVARDGYAAVEMTEMTSELLTGASVYDPQDVKVGTVANLVIAEDGAITDVIVDVGGFLGLGTKPVALKMDQIDILRETDGDEVRIFVPATKADLEAMPEAEI
jgi:sporulation protein YlmC with PRC-barrel domain